jgi:hypothetical protein
MPEVWEAAMSRIYFDVELSGSQIKQWWILQARATYIAREAVRIGELPPASTLPCIDCGTVAYCYDHRDYYKPTVVDPVCRSCNVLRGPAFKSLRKMLGIESRKRLGRTVG